MLRSLFMPALLIPAVLATLLSAGVQAATVKVEVTRFHTLAPPAPAIAGSSIRVEPTDPAVATSLQYGALASAANAALGRAGFRLAAAGEPADHVARISLNGATQQVRKRSPVSVGIGGGTGGRNVGIGGGVSFPVGGGERMVTTALLTLQIRRAADNVALWEGKASTITAGADATSAAPLLLEALLKGFPGPSGKSETVKLKTPQ
jgi:hypothetical protein